MPSRANEITGDEARDLPPATVARSELDAPAMAEIKRYSYVRWLLRILTASLALNVFAAAALALAGIFAGHRPAMQLTARASLRSEATQMFGRDTQVNVDDLLLYLNTVLPLMHRLDDRGAPDLPLLRGLISVHEYEKAAAEAARDLAIAKKNFVVQSLVITRVEDVEADNAHGRISAYVRGYLAIIVQSTSRPVVLPYRAEVLLEMAPPSRLNRFPFVLIKRDWKVSRAAIDWDAARVLAKQKTGATVEPSEPVASATPGRASTKKPR